MDFLLSSLAFALLDSFVLYDAKGFNLHNAWYLGENAISLFLKGWAVHACMPIQFVEIPCTTKNVEKRIIVENSELKTFWSHGTGIFFLIIKHIFVLSAFSIFTARLVFSYFLKWIMVGIWEIYSKHIFKTRTAEKDFYDVETCSHGSAGWKLMQNIQYFRFLLSDFDFCCISGMLSHAGIFQDM